MNTRIVVLAAGKGTRMGADVPKPLVPIAGKPMVAHLVDRIKSSGLDDKPVVVVAPDTKSLFEDQLGETVEFAVQKEQLGTGHAAMAASSFVTDADAVLVLYGDHPFISPETMQNLANLHEKDDATITMLTCTIPNFEGDYVGVKSWSRIVRDEKGRVVKDVQMKDATDEELEIKELNPCIFLFNRDWMMNELPKLQNHNAQEEYYLTDLLKMAVDEGLKISTAPADVFDVLGVNTKEELERAERLAA